MKNIIRMAALAALAAGSEVAGFAQTPKPCTSQTIEGTYAFRVSGEVFAATGLVYRDGIALTHFDGVRTATQVDYVLANGVPVPGPKDENGFNTDETGWYEVHENCTGEVEINFPKPEGGTSGAVIKFFFIISNNGNQLTTIVTSLTPPNSTKAVPVNIHSDAVKID